jgi:hypothetical protein
MTQRTCYEYSMAFNLGMLSQLSAQIQKVGSKVRGMVTTVAGRSAEVDRHESAQAKMHRKDVYLGARTSRIELAMFLWTHHSSDGVGLGLGLDTERGLQRGVV